MSDDGFAHSSYDDLEQLLYDADPEPELADELAEHTLYSPVYRDEDAVQTELQDYFSDWEYYSDDYVDDDPELLRRTVQGGSPTRKPVKSRQSSKRGTKRKLAETRDETTPSDALVRSITGVVWHKHNTQEPPLYKDGQEEKVALMKNWRQVFNTDGWTKSGQNVEDESWAKDMSLADMGLQSVQRQASFDPDAQAMAGAEVDEEEEEEAEDEDEDEDEAAEDLGDGDVLEMEHSAERDSISVQPEIEATGNVARPQRSAGSKLRHEVMNDLIEDEGGGDSDPGEEDAPRKRRRIKPNLPSPPSSNGAPAEDGVAANPGAIRDGKKRKASDELDETSTSFVKGRAKRIASMKAPSSRTQDEATPPMPRATRSKAK
jgi:hypothetical protein